MIIAVIMVFLMSSTILSSQNILNFEEFMTQKSMNESEIDKSELKSLYYNNNPSHYFKNNLTSKNSSPEVGFIDMSDINKLYQSNTIHSSIKLLVVNYNTSGTSLDLSRLQNFSSLDYIIIKCESNCVASTLKSSFVGNSRKKINLFYFIEIPN